MSDLSPRPVSRIRKRDLSLIQNGNLEPARDPNGGCSGLRVRVLAGEWPGGGERRAGSGWQVRSFNAATAVFTRIQSPILLHSILGFEARFIWVHQPPR